MNGILASQVIVRIRIIDVMLELFDGQVSIDGVLVRINLGDKGRFGKVGNGFLPVFHESIGRASEFQKDGEGASVHARVSTGSHDTLTLGLLGRRPIVETELTGIVKGGFCRRRSGRFKEHDYGVGLVLRVLLLLVFNSGLDVITVKAFSSPVTDFEGSIFVKIKLINGLLQLFLDDFGLGKNGQGRNGQRLFFGRIQHFYFSFQNFVQIHLFQSLGGFLDGNIAFHGCHCDIGMLALLCFATLLLAARLINDQ